MNWGLSKSAPMVCLTPLFHMACHLYIVLQYGPYDDLCLLVHFVCVRPPHYDLDMTGCARPMERDVTYFWGHGSFLLTQPKNPKQSHVAPRVYSCFLPSPSRAFSQSKAISYTWGSLGHACLAFWEGLLVLVRWQLLVAIAWFVGYTDVRGLQALGFAPIRKRELGVAWMVIACISWLTKLYIGEPSQWV